MGSKRPAIFDTSITVVDEETLHWLFAHRLLSSCYSKLHHDPKSIKRKIIQVHRKRPCFDYISQGIQHKEMNEEPTGERIRENEPYDSISQENRFNKIDPALANTKRVKYNEKFAKKGQLAYLVPGDYREILRVNVVQPETEDRSGHNDGGFSVNVILPLRMSPEEARTGVEFGLIRLERFS